MISPRNETQMNVPRFVYLVPVQTITQVTPAVLVPAPQPVRRSKAKATVTAPLNSSLKWDQMKADLNAEISAAREQFHDGCLNQESKAEKNCDNATHSDSEEKQEVSTVADHEKNENQGLVNLQIGKVKLQLRPPALGKKRVLYVKYKKPTEEKGALDKPEFEIHPPDQSETEWSSQRDGSYIDGCKKQDAVDGTTEKRFKICVRNVPDESSSSSDGYFDIAKCSKNEKYPGQSSQMYDEESSGDSGDEDNENDNEDNENDKNKEDDKPPKKSVSWTEMIKTYFCKICVFQTCSIRLACQHLLVEHVDVVERLGDFLSKRTVFDSDSKDKQSLYSYILENLPPISRRNSLLGQTLGGESFGGNIVSQSVQAGQGCDSIVTETGGETNENEAEYKSSRTSFINDSCQENSEIDEEKGESCSEEQAWLSHRESILLESPDLLFLLRKWMKVHYQCPRCPIKMYYMQMTSYHHCEKTRRTVLCSACGKYFSSGAYFQHYRRVHSTSQRTAICKFCNKEVNRYTLSTHIRKHHSGPREIYQCGICGRQLGSQQHLTKHEMIHRTEKPYHCSICQRGFTQRNNMKKHMRQHTGERPYKCEKCEKSFTHNVSLKNHLKRYHGIDLWKEGHTGGGRPKKIKTD